VNGSTNSPPVVDISTTPVTGVVPLDTATTITATDPDGNDMTYQVDYGDGSPVQRGTVATTPLNHRYTTPGSYTIRVEVSDGTVSVVRYAHITGALSEPLVANAGDDQSATVDDIVQFDGTGSRPNAAISLYSWDFGDGSSGQGSAATHAYASAGTYTVTLTTSAGTQSKSDTAVVTVKPKPATTGLQVTVTNSGSALADATVLVVASDGTRTSATTGTDGTARLQNLPDATYTVYAVKSGYLPAKGSANVVGGVGTASIELKSGDVATASVTSSPMTPAQIVAAGIDPNDPVNQNVVEFTVQLAFMPNTFSGYSNGTGFATCPTISGIDVACGGSGGGASFTYGDYQVSVSSQVTPSGQRQLVWMVIPGKAKWLKEFFDVQLITDGHQPGRWRRLCHRPWVGHAIGSGGTHARSDGPTAIGHCRLSRCPGGSEPHGRLVPAW
jgi:PKD repeat protein